MPKSAPIPDWRDLDLDDHESLPTVNQCDWPPVPWHQRGAPSTSLEDRRTFLASIPTLDALRALFAANWITTDDVRMAFGFLAFLDEDVYSQLRASDAAMFGAAPMAMDILKHGGGLFIADQTTRIWQAVGEIHADLTAGIGVPDGESHLDREYLIRGCPLKLRLVPGVFAPSKTTMLFARNIQVNHGDRFFEAGFGSLILSILAAQLGARSIKGSEMDESAIELADFNADLNGIEDYQFYRTDLFPPDLELQDVIAGNVPQTPAVLGVDNIHIDAGEDGTDIVLRFLNEAQLKLVPGGRIYVCVASIANARRVRAYIGDHFGEARVLGSQELPIPSYVLPRLDTPHFEELIEAGEVFQKDGTWHSRDELYELRV